MLHAGETPILHFESRNLRAIDIYLALGFVSPHRISAAARETDQLDPTAQCERTAGLSPRANRPGSRRPNGCSRPRPCENAKVA
jgi:hypothetical protein